MSLEPTRTPEGLAIVQDDETVVVELQPGTPTYDALANMAEWLDMSVREVLELLVEDWWALRQRSLYAQNVREVEQLRRLLAGALVGHASTTELAAIVVRLHALEETNATLLLNGMPLARHPAVVALFRMLEADTTSRLGWPDLPRPSRAGVGGRPRLEDSGDMTWVRQLVEAERIRERTGLPLRQCAARVGISERQLAEYRKRAGLLEND